MLQRRRTHESTARFAGRAVAAIGLALILSGFPVSARVFNWGEGNPTPRWPNGTTINIFIPEHPGGADPMANDHVREGIERWTAKLAHYNITLNFIMRAPMAGDPANNRVIVDWPVVARGGADNEGYGTCDGLGGDIVGGSIDIERDNSSGDFMKNLGMHEFGHVLGLDDDATAAGADHNCMDHDVESTGVMDFTARDCAELESLYGAVADGQNAQGDVAGQSQSVGPGMWQYSYDVQWFEGPEMPMLEISLPGLTAGEVNVVQMPPGWELHFPPIFLDGEPNPAATIQTPKLHFYAVDGLASLNAANPTGTFVIQAPFPPGPGEAHALVEGGATGNWTLFPVPVPNAPPQVSAMTDIGRIVMIVLFGAIVVYHVRRRS